MPDPTDILESDEGGGESSRVLRDGVHMCSGSDAGRPAFPHHFKRGGGFSSATLGVLDGGGSGIL